MQQEHIPVLTQEVLSYMKPQPGESYLDLTAGYGGHASAFIERIGKKGRAVLVDRDQQAVDRLSSKFKDSRVEILHQDFLSASKSFQNRGEKFDLVLADLGLSSPHLDKANRGFSFDREGPLDMRMDTRQALTAADIVNNWEEDELIKIFQNYGEVPGSRRIAKAIVSRRPIRTTSELAAIIRGSIKNYRKVRPEAQIFQALRIAVNDELKLLEDSLPVWLELLRPGGRLGVISFHSLEDRIVKQFLKEYGGQRYDAALSILTKQPVVAGQNEIVSNPRSRSAKLRVAQRK